MIRLTRAVPLAVLLTASLATACKKPPQTGVDPSTGSTTTTTTTTARDTAAERRAAEEAARRAEEARRAEVARVEAARRADSIRTYNERMAASVAETRNAITSEIHFDFDRSDISDADRTNLDQKVAALNANQAVRIRISGHADERGSDEYNMALGQRRAAAAKRYLEDHGVASGRIDIVSFGEERGKCDGHDESCWSQNRRDEFEIVAGGDNLQPMRRP